MTVSELMASLRKEPGWAAREKEREHRAGQASLALRIEEEPIVRDLRAIGLEVESVWDLVSRQSSYVSAIPILLKHLRVPYHQRIREGIARALTIREAGAQGWDALKEEFETCVEAQEPERRGLKDALANALSVAATPARARELLSLARERQHGGSRVFLVEALGRVGDSESLEGLRQLVPDAEVGEQATKAIVKLTRRLERRKRS